VTFKAVLDTQSGENLKPLLKRLLILTNSLEMILKTILSAPTKWSKSEVKQTGKL
jgi:hypothetical protein